MNFLNKKKGIFLASLLILMLCIGSVFLLFRQQGNVKISTQPNRRILGTVRLTPTPTLPVLFSDNFADNSENWNVGNEAKYGSTIINGTLTMMKANHKPFREPLPSNVAYDNFSVTTTFTLLQGDQNDSAGLYLRASGDTGQGYYVDIYGNDTFDIAKITVDANQKIHATYLAEPQHSSALHTKGQRNDVMVIMKGTSIVLLINGIVVKLVRDDAFTSGKIMLFVENGSSSNGVIASFDSIAVYAAPEQLPN